MLLKLFYPKLKRPIVLFFFLLMCLLGKPLIAQQTYDPFVLAKAPSSASGYNFGTGITTTYVANGYIYATGIFTGSITFGSITLRSAGDEDIYIVCYDNCSNSVKWAVSIGGSLKDNTDLNKVAISGNSGQIVLTGSINRDDNVTFNGNNGTSQTIAKLPGNGNDIFIAQYEYDNGNLQWVKTYGSAGSGQETGTSITQSTTGSGLVVTGRFYNTVDFGPNSFSNPINLVSAGGSDGFVMRVLTAGSSFVVPMWVAQIGGTGDDIAMDVVTHAAGGSGGINTYVTGIYGDGGGTADIYQPYKNYPVGSPVYYATSVSNGNGHGAFVGCIDYTNTWAWFNSIPVTGTGIGIKGVNTYLDYDYFNNIIYVAGNFDDDIMVYDASSSTVGLSANVGNNDVYTLAYTTAGNFSWTTPVQRLTSTTTSDEIVAGVRADVIGSATTYKIAGSFTNSTTFGSLNLTSAGGTDIYVAMLSKGTGSVADLWRAGSSGDETVYGIGEYFGVANYTLLTGSFQSNTLIGSTALTGNSPSSYYTELTSDRPTIINRGSPILPGSPYLYTTNYTAFTGYQWFFNGVPITGANTSNYTPTVKGLYYVQCTDLNCTGYTYTSNSIFIGEDCAPSSLSTTYPSNYTFTSSASLNNEILDGTITISGSAVVNFSGNIFMTPDAKIIVNSGGTLNINGCTLYSCQQWQGIVVQGGGNINTSSSSTIRDAVVAIYSESPVNINNTDFIFNKVSIALKGSSPSSQINNNQFSDMYLASPYCVVSPSDPIYPYINTNHYIDFQNCTAFDNIWNNTFTGIVIGAGLTLPSAIANVQSISLNACNNTDIENNYFSQNMAYGVYIDNCNEIYVQNNNMFLGIEVQNGIGIFDNTKGVYINNGNTFNSNLIYGVYAENSSKITVGNDFFNGVNGIYFKKVATYFINNNVISLADYGIQAYNDDYQPAQQVTPPLCVMSMNNLSSCEHGIVIAPVLNPFSNITGLPNQLVPGQSLQYIYVTCNSFNNNTWALSVSGELIDHLTKDDPANVFNSSSNWDIITNSSPFFNYHYMGTMPNSTCSRAAVSLDGVSLGVSQVNLIPTSTMYSNCGYMPPMRPVSILQVPVSETCRVYPNPANDHLNIEGAKMGSAFILTDISGRSIFSGIIDNETVTLNIDQLVSGFYIIKIQGQDGAINKIKFVKSK